MEKEKKTGLIFLGALAVGTGLTVALAAMGKAAPPEPGEGGAIIEIEIYDSEGNPVPSNSPRALDEGSSYTVRLTITNTSTKAGVPWDAILTVGIGAITSYTTLITAQEKAELFSAEQTRSFDYPINVPLGSGGETGYISAWVDDPDGTTLASALEDITINEIPIDYGAVIVIG